MKMKSKKGKNMLALLLAFAMIVTGIVVTPVNAQAAKKEMGIWRYPRRKDIMKRSLIRFR